MNSISRICRMAASFPFRKLDNYSQRDKFNLVSKINHLTPPPPSKPASSGTQPFSGWLKSLLFGFASCEPYGADPDDPHGYYEKVFTVAKVRETFDVYDVPSMSDEEWMESVFKRLHHDVVQRKFLKLAEEEKGRRNFKILPMEMEILITSGTVQQVKDDIEKTDVKTKFITFSGIEDSLADAWDLSLMKAKGKQTHHATVEELIVNVPTAPKRFRRKVYRDLEWTGHKYWLVKGIYNSHYKGKQAPLLKEGYELQLFDDVVVLNELDAKRKPKRVVAYWWHPICNDIRTNELYNKAAALPAGFTATDMLTVIANTPIARITHDAYKFPIVKGKNSGYGSDRDHVKWRDLPHPIQEDYNKELRKTPNTVFSNLPDPCHGSAQDFEWKHIRRIPGTFTDLNGNQVYVKSVDELFHLDNADYRVLRSLLNLSVIVIKPPAFDVNTMHLSKDVGVTGNSIVQRHPKACNNVYASWDKTLDGYPIIVHQKETITTVDVEGELNDEPWKRDPTRFQEKLDSERKLGGIVKETVKGKTAVIERSFLLKNWHIQLWLDLNDDKPRHLEGLYPRRMHSNPIKWKWIKTGYREAGANGLVGGKVPFGRELVPMFARTTHFHRCDTNVQCEMCPKKRADAVVNELLKENLD